jgi:hypothetical protein
VLSARVRVGNGQRPCFHPPPSHPHGRTATVGEAFLLLIFYFYCFFLYFGFICFIFQKKDLTC